MTQKEQIPLTEAFDFVFVTREQASAILQKMGELFTDISSDVRQSFIDGSEAILTTTPTEPESK